MLTVGGVDVRKEVQRYASNSGKSGDFSVTFTWKGADGESHRLEKPSHYEGNRRNDADRNWGLPEWAGSAESGDGQTP